MADPDTYLDQNLPRLHADFAELIRLRSISTDPAYREDVRSTAEWVRARMERSGLEATIEETPGNPLVMGRHRAGDDAPTLLVYAHYDVQPADPLDEWRTPAFELTQVDDGFLGRGVADDKAQVIIHTAAAEALLQTTGLPINLIFLFEGEEEIGSVNLTPYIREHVDELAPDHVIIADSLMFNRVQPSLIFQMRGMAYTEITVRVADFDLHSGQYGGAVPNPANILARIIASFHDEEGRVAIEGFYDEVRDLPAELREAWSDLAFDEAAYRRSAGNAALAGEPGYSTTERLWIRPCLDVNGMISGYTGPGKKTVLPARASAKVSCRLVPDQDPARIAELVRAHVAARTPEGAEVTVGDFQMNPPWRAEHNGPLYDAAAKALSEVYGVQPVRVASGGTLPIARDFIEVLTPSLAVMGFAVPGANMHAPNEWLPVSQIINGAKSVARLYQGLAEG